MIKKIKQQFNLIYSKSELNYSMLYLMHRLPILYIFIQKLKQGTILTFCQQKGGNCIFYNILGQIQAYISMLDAFVYMIFFWILVGEAVLFLLLNIPTPKGIKGKIINFIANNKIFAYIIYAHLGFSVLAIFFYLDLWNSQSHFSLEKQKMKNQVARHIGTQLRLGFLSYTILKIQRNKYITFMLIYTSIALNLFVLLLRHIYKHREYLQSLGLLDKIERKQSQKVQPHSISVDARDSSRQSTESVKDKKTN